MYTASHFYFGTVVAPQSHFTQFLHLPEGHYKILKAVDPILDTVGEIAKAAHASGETLRGIEFGRFYAGAMRNVLGIFHVFSVLIPRFGLMLKLAWNLGRGVIYHEDVHITLDGKKSQGDYNEASKGAIEQLLVGSALLCRFIYTLGSLVAFCICRPILLAERFGGIKLSSSARAIGNAFSVFMLIRYSSAFMGDAFELRYQCAAYQRSEIDEKQTVQFIRQATRLVVSLVERILQLLHEIGKLLCATAPPWFRLPLTLMIAAIGLYKVWLKVI